MIISQTEDQQQETKTGTSRVNSLRLVTTNPTKTSKLSKLSFKQKEAPAKKGQAKTTSKFRPKIPAASVAEVQEDVNLVEGDQDAVSSNPNLQSPSNNNKEQLQQDTKQTTNSSTNNTTETYSAPQVNNNPSNRIT
ncbi:hypothetical protein MJO29_016020 [Puccinia striiformis f. sp. tritici]|nr:hypothetical protein MJO29_016020 [Puccinia striiformis f. sp. tritici]